MLDRIKNLPLGMAILITLAIWGIPLTVSILSRPMYIPHCLFFGGLAAVVWMVSYLSLERKQ